MKNQKLLPLVVTLFITLMFSTCDDTLKSQIAFNKMWFILCEVDAPRAEAMTKSGDNWIITVTLGADSYVKFNADDNAPAVWGTAAVPDASEKWFYPTSNGVPARGKVFFRYGEDSPNAWRIMSFGEYKITLNPREGSITFSGGGSQEITAVSLVGDAALGWEDGDGNPLPLFMNSAGEDTFVYEGALTAGYLKISCDTVPNWNGRWFLPSVDTVLNDGDEHTMEYSITGDGGEDGPKWQITADAQYLITLNKETRTIQCVKTGEGQPVGTTDTFNNMWFILCGIDAPHSSAMTASGDDWTITVTLNANTYVKFNGEDDPRTVWGTAAVPDTSMKWFYPSANGTAAADTVNFRYGADSPNAWRIASSGEYTITLRPQAGTVTFTDGGGGGGETPGSSLWLVYTKEAPYLTAADAFEMDDNGDGTYTWEGALAGWYKFCSSDDAPASYGDGMWLGPNSNNAAPAGAAEDAVFSSDYAWYIPQGHYLITLSPEEETVIIDKTGDPVAEDFEELWVLGIAAMPPEVGGDTNDIWNSPKSANRRMTPQANGTYTWSYNFSDMSYFRIVCRNNGIIFYVNPSDLSGGNVPMVTGTVYNMFTRDQYPGSSADLVSWRVTNTGLQTITVNPVAQTVTLTNGGAP